MDKPLEMSNTTETKLKRIAWLSSKNPEKKYHQLMHHFNWESLTQCCSELDGKKAVGVDRVTKEEYTKELVSNLNDLLERMKRMGYRPGPVRQVLIPKEGKPGATRPLGISRFEDKIIQKMTQKVLESIYEPLFLEQSYGFRPGRGCHDAIQALHSYLYLNEVETVIDVDLANFFGTIDHEMLVEMLREKIKDKKFIRYIIRMFKAGVLSDGELTVSDDGVPQGSGCSPVLSNIFAHHVIDVWLEKVVKKHCHGKIEFFRYCDDMVLCCQYRSDATRVKRALAKRLAKHKLTMNEDKTKMVPYSKRKADQGQKQGRFDFLGFTFYLGRSKSGARIPKLQTSSKRMSSKLNKVNDWARATRNRYPLKKVWRVFGAKLRGHIEYYSVSFNSRKVAEFVTKAIRILFKWLNRRSQKRSFNWEKFQLFIEKFPLPETRVRHKLF